jgi:hypothetical protein
MLAGQMFSTHCAISPVLFSFSYFSSSLTGLPEICFRP